MGASVKIMLSYDYCHFEVCLSTSDENLSKEYVDDMRKECQRLADKAVKQYRIAKSAAQAKLTSRSEVKYLRREVDIIRKFPPEEWTPDQKAMVKTLEDHEFLLEHDYDYQDDWEDRP